MRKPCWTRLCSQLLWACYCLQSEYVMYDGSNPNIPNQRGNMMKIADPIRKNEMMERNMGIRYFSGSQIFVRESVSVQPALQGSHSASNDVRCPCTARGESGNHLGNFCHGLKAQEKAATDRICSKPRGWFMYNCGCQKSGIIWYHYAWILQSIPLIKKQCIHVTL